MNYTIKVESDLLVALKQVKTGDSFTMNELLHFNHRSLIDYTAKQRKAKLSVTGLTQKQVKVDFLEPLFKRGKG
jgi:hypothetical protein